MNVLKLPIWLIMCALSWFTEVNAQKLPDVLQQVLRSDTAYLSLSCNIDIKLDVPGLNMPDKTVQLTLEKGKKPKIKGKGITVLPRHGIIGQYRKFLEVDCQSIPLREEGDTIVYKVVSLDKKTDWITVDFKLTKSDVKIHSMLISTRKNGEYLVRHFYKPYSAYFPVRSEISFEAMPLKLPLKFMGKQEGMDLEIEDKGPVTGKVLLVYSDISLEKLPQEPVI